MTTHEPNPEVVDQWLDRHQRELADGLDGALDVEAGLREVLLQSRHDAAVDALGSVLDVEGGLAAILPAGRSDRETLTTPSPGRIDPVTRLALRAVPRVVAAYEVFNDTYYRTHKLDADLMRICVEITQPAELPRWDALVIVVDKALDLTRVLTDDLSPGFDRSDDRPSEFNMPRIRAFGLSMGLVADLLRALGYVRRLADIGRVDMFVAHELADALRRSRALVPALVELRAGELRYVIGVALNTEPPLLDSTAVRAFLDDFTTSDLRSADLSGVDLTGVRWSEAGTRWPPMVDIDDLKSRSEAEGDGIWVVRSGTATVRDLAELA
ncbi:hypothetical protein [Streptomyces abikoensis]|uniref:hypothetical protein n=1 Tax=Streptomyces abikoensis TaxID=97398 RepID=UPI001679F3C8|nr:hypothetical protein [Streptomyces abikoensis]GGP61045.1 hypothetical protein GCM10010214_38400 [Streptomyces abikoensis]